MCFSVKMSNVLKCPKIIDVQVLTGNHLLWKCILTIHSSVFWWLSLLLVSDCSVNLTIILYLWRFALPVGLGLRCLLFNPWKSYLSVASLNNEMKNVLWVHLFCIQSWNVVNLHCMQKCSPTLIELCFYPGLPWDIRSTFHEVSSHLLPKYWSGSRLASPMLLN